MFCLETVKKNVVEMAWCMEPGGIMCFSPTMEQFRDFSAFIAYMEDQGAHKYGIAKVSRAAQFDIALWHNNNMLFRLFLLRNGVQDVVIMILVLQ